MQLVLPALSSPWCKSSPERTRTRLWYSWVWLCLQSCQVYPGSLALLACSHFARLSSRDDVVSNSLSGDLASNTHSFSSLEFGSPFLLSPSFPGVGLTFFSQNLKVQKALSHPCLRAVKCFHNIFLSFTLKIFTFLLIYVCMPCVFVCLEAKQGCWIPWNYCYRQLWVVQCGCWDPKSNPLPKQPTFLMVKPSFHPWLSVKRPFSLVICMNAAGKFSHWRVKAMVAPAQPLVGNSWVDYLSIERVHWKMVQWEDHGLVQLVVCRLHFPDSENVVWQIHRAQYHFTVLKGWTLLLEEEFVCYTCQLGGIYLNIADLYYSAPPMLTSLQFNYPIRWLHRHTYETSLRTVPKIVVILNKLYLAVEECKEE